MNILPTFWTPFVLILATCLVLAWREDVIHGPQLRGKDRQWTPRYAFCLSYAARIILLGALCAFMQGVAWIVEVVA